MLYRYDALSNSNETSSSLAGGIVSSFKDIIDKVSTNIKISKETLKFDIFICINDTENKQYNTLVEFIKWLNKHKQFNICEILIPTEHKKILFKEYYIFYR